MTTNLDNRIAILTDLFDNYRDRYTELTEFVQWHDLGLPFAWAAKNGHAILTDAGEALVNKTFDNLLEVVSKTDEGFGSLDDLLGIVYED